MVLHPVHRSFPPGMEETQESLVTLLNVSLESTHPQWERETDGRGLTGSHL